MFQMHKFIPVNDDRLLLTDYQKADNGSSLHSDQLVILKQAYQLFTNSCFQAASLNELYLVFQSLGIYLISLKFFTNNP